MFTYRNIESPVPRSRAASFSPYLAVSDIPAYVTMHSLIYKLLGCINNMKENHGSELAKSVRIQVAYRRHQ